MSLPSDRKLWLRNLRQSVLICGLNQRFKAPGPGISLVFTESVEIYI
jgi:hypothetical protein